MVPNSKSDSFTFERTGPAFVFRIRKGGKEPELNMSGNSSEDT